MPPDLVLARATVGLVAEGRRLGVPWCVWCNTAATDPSTHRRCLTSLWSAQWGACQACWGGGLDPLGISCFVCHGVGFIADDDATAARHAVVLGLADGVSW